jgi:hypothetical protein
MWGWASTLTSAALIATFFGMNLTRYIDLDDIIAIEYVMYLPYVKNADVIIACILLMTSLTQVLSTVRFLLIKTPPLR